VGQFEVTPRWVSLNRPVTQIHVEVAQPAYYSVEQAIEMMGLTKEHNELMAYVAMGLFAGIRPEETQRLTWEHVNLETAEITIPHTISKTKKTRLFKIEPNLLAWLKAHKSTGQPLIPSENFLNKLVAFKKSLSFKWIADGLRHTFATFEYARSKNLETLRYIMGNSPGVIERFYRSAISEATVNQYWGIVP
jgi:integrase